MTSKIAVIVSIISIIIISSEAASIARQKDIPIIEDICKILGSEEYQLTVMNLDTDEIGGCAFIEHKSTDLISKSLSMWIGDLYNGEGRCGEEDMVHFYFPCKSEWTLPWKASTEEKVYVYWRGRIISHEPGRHLRCALIEMVKGNNNNLFRMAISENNSCSELLDMLSQPQPKVSDKIVVVQLNKASESQGSHQLRSRRSINNTNGTMKNLFTDRTDIWIMGG